MTELLQKLAFEAFVRAVLKNLGIDRSAFTQVKFEPMKSNEPDRMTIVVTLNDRGDFDRPDVIGQVTVNALGEPYGTEACIIQYRPANQHDWRYPYAWEHDWLHAEDVAVAA